jgi:hypothetical protein
MIPDDWCKGIIKPLHKSGSIYDLNNYRGITLTSNVNKVFSKILETLILDFISKSEIHVKRSDNDFIIISPPYFRNSFGISSIPGALPILRLFKAFVIDSFE